MRRMSTLVAVALLSAGAATTIGARAQAEAGRQDLPGRARTPAPLAPAVGPPTPAAVELSFPEKRWRRDILRIGNNFVLPADDGANNVTIIGGDATLEGRVAQDVVVVLGHVEVSPTALIDGSLVVVGGSATIADGARLRRDLVVVGGRFEAPASFAPGGDYMLIGPQVFGDRFAGLFDWLARGLLWGRLIVPTLGWVWLVAAVSYLLYLLLGVMFEKPVREITEALEARPFTTLVVGFLVTLIAGPVCVILAVTVIGIAVIPLVLVTLCAAWVFGKIGTARWIGRSVASAAESPRADAIRSFSIGFAIVCLAYMVPLLGVVTWLLLSVFGVGAAALSFIAAYRRESPVFPRAPRPVTVPMATAPVAAASMMVPAMALAGGALSPFDEAPAATVAADAVSDPGGHDLITFPRAAFRDRLASGVLDLILLLMMMGLFDRLFEDGRFFALALFYFVGFWTWKGTTLGGIICQLRIVRVDNQPLRFVDALVRGLSAIFSLLVLALGFLWILRDPDRQAWHDRIAGTYVVKVPRNWPF